MELSLEYDFTTGWLTSLFRDHPARDGLAVIGRGYFGLNPSVHHTPDGSCWGLVAAMENHIISLA